MEKICFSSHRSALALIESCYNDLLNDYDAETSAMQANV